MLRHLKQYDIRPKRSLGQNFLVDGDILKREVAYAELRG
ncbi:MAG: ribosomal RNA small subunit methyltransferase A, partial [Gemmatimonadetes bacterium]|nr:ribosomal RNA small subunit methyltransferase A [Gemmatimonadota bacterium]